MHKPLKQYTVGQVIDNIKPGQYALKLDGETGDYYNFGTFDIPPFKCDKETGIITFTNGIHPHFISDYPNRKPDRFIIISEEEYQMIKNNFKGVE